jgi:hypothetical protein
MRKGGTRLKVTPSLLLKMSMLIYGLHCGRHASSLCLSIGDWPVTRMNVVTCQISRMQSSRKPRNKHIQTRAVLRAGDESQFFTHPQQRLDDRSRCRLFCVFQAAGRGKNRHISKTQDPSSTFGRNCRKRKSGELQNKPRRFSMKIAIRCQFAHRFR